MRRPRVIPCLLLAGSGLVKTKRFRDPKYLGDPINIVKIFNNKEVDEAFLIDIYASREGRGPNFEMLRDIAGEAFMPMGYGGGVRSIEQIRDILSCGFEKIMLNSAAIQDPDLIRSAVGKFGSSTIVASIDVRRNFWGNWEVIRPATGKAVKIQPVEYARALENWGAGEILINSIDRDGTMSGYDVELISSISKVVSVPVVACGGAGELGDFRRAVQDGGASAVAAGSLFVFQGPHKAVLISYPSEVELQKLFADL